MSSTDYFRTGYASFQDQIEALRGELAAKEKECAELRQLLRIYCSEQIEDEVRKALKLSPRSQP